MQRLVAEHHPGRARRECEGLLRCGPLVVGIRLGQVVQLQHAMVVLRALTLGDAEPMHQPRLAGQYAVRLRDKTPGEIAERLADAPHARRIRIDVVEHAQQPLAMQRIRRERINMQARIVLAPAHRPSGDLGRPQRGAGPCQVRGIGRKQCPHQLLGGVGIAADQRGEIAQVGRVAHRAAHIRLVGPQVDVLGLAVGPAGVEKAPLARIERKRQCGEIQHVATLQRSAHRSRLIRHHLGHPVAHQPWRHHLDRTRCGA